MPAVINIHPSRFLYHFTAQDPVEVEHPVMHDLGAHLRGAAPTAWLWCFSCERAFQLSDARNEHGGVACGYDDCTGAPLDFWSWEAYRAFAGAAPQAPEPRQRYPLAA